MTGPDPKPPEIPRDRLMAETRLAALRGRMVEAEAAYYQHDDPIISDAGYDALRAKCWPSRSISRSGHRRQPQPDRGRSAGGGFAKVTHAGYAVAVQRL